MATQTRIPISDLLVLGTWTPYPATPTTRFDKVDDGAASKDDDTTYIIGLANNDYIDFGFGVFTIPAGAVVSEVRVYAYAKDATSGVNSAKARVSCGATPTAYDHGTTYDPNGTIYTLYSWAWATNPHHAGYAWTPDDVNGIGTYGLKRFGFKTPDAAPDVRFTSVWVECTYQPIVEKSGSDGILVAAGEAQSSLGSLGRTESLGLTLGEAQGSLGILGRSDPIGVALGEVQASFLSADRGDTANISLSEANALLAALDMVDTLAAALIELANIIPGEAVTPIVASDGLGLGLSENIASLLSLLGRSEELTLGFVEGQDSLLQAGRTDALDIGLADGSTLLNLLLRSDILLAAVTEATDLLGSLLRADSVSLALPEIIETMAVLSAADALDTGIADDASLLVAHALTDTLELILLEGWAILTLIERGDALGVSLAEVRATFSSLARSDQLASGIQDLAQSAAMINVADTILLLLGDASTILIMDGAGMADVVLDILRCPICRTGWFHARSRNGTPEQMLFCARCRQRNRSDVWRAMALCLPTSLPVGLSLDTRG